MEWPQAESISLSLEVWQRTRRWAHDRNAVHASGKVLVQAGELSAEAPAQGIGSPVALDTGAWARLRPTEVGRVLHPPGLV